MALYPLLLCGGCVRDALLGVQPEDYDCATEATPEQVKTILSGNPELKFVDVGLAFGVIRVRTPEGNEYELATFRKDGYNFLDLEEFKKFLKNKNPAKYKEFIEKIN